ncbi:DUF6115 domain-containing protein [Sediminibacillus halophilus]|uniref:Coupling factor for flagellin transcription and translation n=1 Tax=Sediminibacillus halophilus TaxID=482461 RepID=A0A1G9MGL2_9BACI|nr:hypothetical protein [Sediminibacillus halophilus]SDL73359.1 hypothetical protein SAMN05216244_0581 [Sediminibacillus halophilus]
MLTFLLFISLLLHIFTFIAIRLLFQKLQQSGNGGQVKTDSLQQSEEMLSAFLHEIREENDRLLKELDDHSSKNKQTAQKNSNEGGGSAFVKAEQTPPYKQSYRKHHTSGKAEDSEYVPPIPEVQQDTVEESVTAKVYSLYDQGYTVDEIAKKLDKGKTEVELMVKFHRKN